MTALQAIERHAVRQMGHGISPSPLSPKSGQDLLDFKIRPNCFDASFLSADVTASSEQSIRIRSASVSQADDQLRVVSWRMDMWMA